MPVNNDAFLRRLKKLGLCDVLKGCGGKITLTTSDRDLVFQKSSKKIYSVKCSACHASFMMNDKDVGRLQKIVGECKVVLLKSTLFDKNIFE